MDQHALLTIRLAREKQRRNYLYLGGVFRLAGFVWGEEVYATDPSLTDQPWTQYVRIVLFVNRVSPIKPMCANDLSPKGHEPWGEHPHTVNIFVVSIDYCRYGQTLCSYPALTADLWTKHVLLKYAWM